MTMPVVAALSVGCLGGCGGGGDDSVNPGGGLPGSSNGSIMACFTANKQISFSMTSSNVPPGEVELNRITIGPDFYNNQAVMKQTAFYSNETVTTILYYSTTNDGARWVAVINPDGTVINDGTFFHQNMSPGQTVTSADNYPTTFVGFEAITLAGKTFTNTCHVRSVPVNDPQVGLVDQWYAPGYGLIKSVLPDGEISQYGGDL